MPDSEIPFDLGFAFSTIYEKAAYDLTIDYSDSPPPLALAIQEN